MPLKKDLKWTDWRITDSIRGRVWERRAYPDNNFMRVWRLYSRELKQSGYAVGKTRDDRWMVKQRGRSTHRKEDLKMLAPDWREFEATTGKKRLDQLTIMNLKVMVNIVSGDDEDFARTRNNVGFSKFDAEFGHILDDAPYWTPNMQHAAYKLMKKYKRQIPEKLYKSVYL